MTAWRGRNCFQGPGTARGLRQRKITTKRMNAEERKAPVTINGGANVHFPFELKGLTDATFNRLCRRGTDAGQRFEEPVQNTPALLFPAEGPPLEQIIGRAVDTALAFKLSAGTGGIIPHTPPQMVFAHFCLSCVPI